MPSGKSDEYQTRSGKLSEPGIELDLDKLEELYGNDSGCRVRVIIMEDGDSVKPPKKSYAFHVPDKKKRGGGSGKG